MSSTEEGQPTRPVLQHLPIISFAKALLTYLWIVQVAVLQQLFRVLLYSSLSQVFCGQSFLGSRFPPVVIILQRESIKFTAGARRHLDEGVFFRV